MKMTEALNTASDNVRQLLSDYPETRDSDKMLWLAYLVRHHGLRRIIGDDAYFEMKRIILNKKTPTMESITRARRKIQENGEFIGKHRSTRMGESVRVSDWSKR